MTEKIRGYPVLMNPTGDSVSVVWVSSGPCCGSVEYGSAPDQLTHRIMSADRYGFSTLDEIHRVRLKRLPLGEPVYYRVITHKNTRKINVEDASC